MMPIPLDGNNYLSWARVVSRNLNTKGMARYVNGKIPTPYPTMEGYEECERNDELVTTWILNSLDQKLYNMFAFTSNAKVLWDSIKDLYGQQDNLYQIFELKWGIAKTKQDNLPFTEYLGKLRCMWDELAIFRPPTTDVVTLQRRLEQDKMFELLSGLNPEYEAVQTQLLLNSDILSLANICSKIIQEETRKKVMNVTKREDRTKSSAFFVRTDTRDRFPPKTSFRGRGGARSIGNRNSLICDHCKKIGHTKDRCWFLNPHLQPAKDKFPGGEERSHLQANTATAGGIADRDPRGNLMEQLAHHLIHQMNKDGGEKPKPNSAANPPAPVPVTPPRFENLEADW